MVPRASRSLWTLDAGLTVSLSLVMQVNIDMSAAGSLPALWNAEEPNLYILVLSLVTQDGEHLDSESTQVLQSQSLSVL